MSIALVPSSAIALSWAVIEGDGQWSVAVLAWIVTLWIAALRRGHIRIGHSKP